MTREEAIHELQEDKRLYETEVCHAGDGTPDGRLLEALDMAIEALSVIDIVDLTNGNTITKAEYDAVSREDTVTLNSPISIQAEMVAVVRCKDCRHRDLFSCPLTDNDFQKDEDFCSWGERKGGDTK